MLSKSSELNSNVVLFGNKGIQEQSLCLGVKAKNLGMSIRFSCCRANIGKQSIHNVRKCVQAGQYSKSINPQGPGSVQDSLPGDSLNNLNELKLHRDTVLLLTLVS